MRFVVDQQLPPALTAWLRGRGHDAEHVRDIGLRDADDADILRHAEQVAAAIITKDQDFVSRRSTIGRGPVIVWLRIGNSTTLRLLAWLDSKWPTIEAAIAAGAAVIEVR